MDNAMSNAIKNWVYNLKKLFYLIIISLLNLIFIPDETSAQRWVIHTVPQIAGKNVRDVLIDRYGNLWCATDNGINKFNGKWFIFRVEDGLVNNNVRVIEEDWVGNLWFGTEGGLSKINPNIDLNNPSNWMNYTVENTDSGLVCNDISSIVFDTSKNIWCGTENSGISVCHFPENSLEDPLLNKKNWDTYTIKDSLSSNEIKTLEVDGSNNIWAATELKINIYESKSKKWKPFDLMDFLANESVRVIYKDSKANMWIGTISDDGVYKISPNNLVAFDESRGDQNFKNDDGLGENNVVAIKQDSKGAIWLGHQTNGVSMAMLNADLNDPSNWKKIAVEDGLSTNHVASIIEDSEQNMWFSHLDNGGISQLDQSWLTILADKEDFTNYITKMFVDELQNLWIGTEFGLVRLALNANLLLEKNIEYFKPESSGLQGHRIYSIFEDSQSYLWFGTEAGLNRIKSDQINEKSQWQLYDINDGLISNEVNWIIEDSKNYLWFATNNGIIRVHVNIDTISNSKNWLLIDTSNGPISNEVRVCAIDSTGKLWFGTSNGISIINPAMNPKDSANWANYTTQNGLIDSVINSIYTDVQGTVWIATQNGINKVCYQNDSLCWTKYTSNDGLIHNFVTSITQLNKNEYWFGTAIGLSKLNMAGSNQKWTSYNVSSGLKSNRIHFVLADTINDNVWIGTRGGGVTRYVPQSRAPETYIDSFYDIITDNNIRYDFHGVDMITPDDELYFEYKLDNDSNWTKTSNRYATIFVEDSEIPAYHIFEVRAIDAEGNVDSTSDKDDFFKINAQYGGNIEISDTLNNNLVNIFVPPKLLAEGKTITITPVPKYNLEDTLNVIVCYDISDKSLDIESNLSKPLVLKISLYKFADFNNNNLSIFQLTESEGWKPLGGTIKHGSNVFTISTVIFSLGRFAVKNERRSDGSKINKILIQPRIFSPSGGGQGHGERTNISFFLENDSPTTIKVFNIGGRLKKVLIKGVFLGAGINTIEWDGTDDQDRICPSGLYIISIEANGEVKTKTVMLSNKYKD